MQVHKVVQLRSKVPRGAAHEYHQQLHTAWELIHTSMQLTARWLLHLDRLDYTPQRPLGDVPRNECAI